MLFGSLFAGIEEGAFVALVPVQGSGTGPLADFGDPVASQDIPLIFGDETA